MEKFEYKINEKSYLEPVKLLIEKDAKQASSLIGKTFLPDKTCSDCGKSVSLSASAGQNCPHCGVL